MEQTPPVNLPRVPASTDLTYSSYLKVPELLDLQHPESNPAHHDEMLFIIIHQSYELWFKLILHEMENAIHNMNQDKILRAHHFVSRVVTILNNLVNQIHILQTMTPAEFLQFRDRLNPASGFQSYQFREVEFLAGAKSSGYLKFFENQPQIKAKLQARLDGPSMRDALMELLIRQGFNIPTNYSEIWDTEEGRKEILPGLLDIYQNPEKEHPLYLLCESLIDFDQSVSLWREHHVRVVERIIGFKRGTGGSSGVNYLRSTVNKKCFPSLWEVRSLLA